MGFMDEAKKKLTDAVDKHGDKINQGLDKAAAAVDQRTGGKHTDKINQGVARAKQGLDNLDGRNDDLGRTTAASGTSGGQDSPGTGPGPSRGTQHPAGPSNPDTPTEKKEPKAPTGPMGDGTPGGSGVDR